jgi:hypothetical protein
MNAPIDNWDTGDGRKAAPPPRWANDAEWRATEKVPYVPSAPLADSQDAQNLDRLAAELAASMAAEFAASVTSPPPPSPPQRMARPDAMEPVPSWMQSPRALDPTVPPMPPMHETSRFRLGHAVRAIVLAGVAAGGGLALAYGAPDLFGKLFGDKPNGVTASEPAIAAPKSGRVNTARLIANDIRGVAGDWIPLNIFVDGTMTDGDAIITGFTAATTLSVGENYGSSGWRVRVADLPKLQAHFPPDFAGILDLLVELRRGDSALLDRRAVRFEVVNPRVALASMAPPPVQNPPPSAQAQGFAASPPPVAAPTPAPAQAAAPARRDETVIAALPRNPVTPAPERSEPPVRQLDPAEVAVMMRRGEELLKTGDVAGARLLLQRAAEARHGGAALTLAATYDPIMLRRLAVLGVSGDVSKARQWYERARELGQREAAERLEALARWER